MKTRKILLTLLLLIGLCGCSKDDAASVAKKVKQAMEKTPCSQSELIVQLNSDLVWDEEEPFSINYIIDTLINISQDPISSHVTTLNYYGYPDSEYYSILDSFTLNRNNEFVTYYNQDNVWLKDEPYMSEKEMKKSASVIYMDEASLAIDETVTELEGQPVICLTWNLDSDRCYNTISSIVYEFCDSDKLNFDAVSGYVELYVNPETYLPIMELMYFNGGDELFEDTCEDMQVDSITVSFLGAEGDFISYEPIEEAQVPENVDYRAEKWERLLNGIVDNGDGTYSISEGSVVTDITAPEGFELKESSYDSLSFERSDKRRISYTIYYMDEPGDEAFMSVINSAEERYKTGGGSVKKTQGTYSSEDYEFTTCDLTTKYKSYTDKECHGWTLLQGDLDGYYYLEVVIRDGINDGLGTVKSADITDAEIKAYYSTAGISDLMK